uniref:Uncharacterized protein n=1 Tax=Biomphalaria glabrata TaxID=6526 RepID=A0A2C9LAU3_BIOGL
MFYKLSALGCFRTSPVLKVTHPQCFINLVHWDVSELRLSLRSPIINVLIEMPKSDLSTLFLAEIKKAKDVYSQVPAFGEPAAIFPWLEKYKRQSTDFNQSSGENPFAEDIFDPLKHMSLDGTNMHVVDTESSRQTTWFQDDMSSLSSSYEHLKPAQKSRSRDSLDKILGGYVLFTWNV